jgi:hypothetical protein
MVDEETHRVISAVIVVVRVVFIVWSHEAICAHLFSTCTQTESERERQRERGKGGDGLVGAVTVLLSSVSQLKHNDYLMDLCFH